MLHGEAGIGDQSVFGVSIVAEIRERAALQPIKQRIIGQRREDAHRVYQRGDQAGIPEASKKALLC